MGWVGAAVAFGVAVLAEFADRRTVRRTNLDRVGWLDWRTVQMGAVIAAVVCVIAAQR
ncbi:hypothetical protein [Sphingomonas sp. PAMC 26621]|uniref:hypothetical protein n=1 Tax=Sphingomonas sp. PAMC 26621 TaxID=1112213 RepID=UPI00031ABC13|nr:hypothetical protein [Sphingomonas sp. PAMC 26621]